MARRELQRLKVIENAVACGQMTTRGSSRAGLDNSHLADKLRQVEGIDTSRETVRIIVRQDGVRSPQRRRAPRYRRPRGRKARMGIMVPSDASREDWLEGRGRWLTLIGCRDDATNTVLAEEFQLEPEHTIGYLRQFRRMPASYGAPLSLY